MHGRDLVHHVHAVGLLLHQPLEPLDLPLDPVQAAQHILFLFILNSHLILRYPIGVPPISNYRISGMESSSMIESGYLEILNSNALVKGFWLGGMTVSVTRQGPFML